jgi:glycosyltransferase involved in cell wall biosynthesis
MSSVGSVLMVALHYPPEGSSSGVLRTLKFSKYLPRHGWTPHILTLREHVYQVKDAGLLADIPPEAVVHRTGGFDSTRALAIRGRHLAMLSVPDPFISWLPFGVAGGLAAIRRAGIRAIFSTSPIPTAHLIAAALKRRTGLPWIADFRDPWIEEGQHPAPGSIRYAVESRLERAVIRGADRIVATTPYLRADFLARYPTLDPDKIGVIYNGYDESDFSHLPVPPREPRFEILHAGLVERQYRDPAPLLEAVARLIGAGVMSREEVRVVFLGAWGFFESSAGRELVGRLGLGGVLEVSRRIPNRATLERLRRASCLLILQASDDTRSLIPAKAFECLRVERPILAITGDGATADLLKKMDRCAVIGPSDTEGLQNALVSLYQAWKESPQPILSSRQIKHFERSALTAELAQTLHELRPEPNRA